MKTKEKKWLKVFNFLVLIFFALLLFFPSTRADIYVPNIYQDFSFYHLWLLLPIVLIETTIAYILFNMKVFFDAKVTLWRCLIMFFIANVLTTVIGIFYSLIHYAISDTSLNLVLMYILTALIEAPVIYLFIRKKIQTPSMISLYVSFIVNVYSYLFLFIFI
jgi:hypothetical protein